MNTDVFPKENISRKVPVCDTCIDDGIKVGLKRLEKEYGCIHVLYNMFFTTW